MIGNDAPFPRRANISIIGDWDHKDYYQSQMTYVVADCEPSPSAGWREVYYCMGAQL